MLVGLIYFLFEYLPVCMSISAYWSICLSQLLYVCLSVGLFMWLFVCLLVCLFACLFFYMFVSLLVCIMFLYGCVSACLSMSALEKVTIDRNNVFFSLLKCTVSLLRQNACRS